jgi:uncharacterized membrane protein
MKLGIRIGGHPLHAILSDFPLVLLLAWVALDGGALLVGSAWLWEVGHWALVAGVIAAGLAAVAGLLDYLGLPESKPEAMPTATVHLLVMGTVILLAAVALLFRAPRAPSGGAAFAFHLGVLVLVATGLGVGGWFGGHLVFHHGVGVEEQGAEVHHLK